MLFPPKQHQRLRGVAGSGKSMVIAQRAANLASEGKSSYRNVQYYPLALP